MGRYSGADKVKVYGDKHPPLLTEQVNESLVEVMSVDVGDNYNTGLPFVATRVRVVDSDVYPAGEVRTMLIAQHGGAEQRKFFFIALKKWIGSVLGMEPTEVTEKIMEDFDGGETGIGAIVSVKVFDKPPNDKGKVYKDTASEHFAADRVEMDKFLSA